MRRDATFSLRLNNELTHHPLENISPTRNANQIAIHENRKFFFGSLRSGWPLAVICRRYSFVHCGSGCHRIQEARRQLGTITRKALSTGKARMKKPAPTARPTHAGTRNKRKALPKCQQNENRLDHVQPRGPEAGMWTVAQNIQTAMRRQRVGDPRPIITPSAPTAAGREICPIIGRHPRMPAKPTPHRISVTSNVKNKSPTQLGSQSPTIAPKTRQSRESIPVDSRN